jgi:hypothetical protein
MVDNPTDFWPKDIGEVKVVAPVSLMRSQAALLFEKTKGLLEGRINVRTSIGSFYYSFQIVVPALGGYVYELFRVENSVNLYPVKGTFEGLTTDLESEEAFTQWLKDVLSSERTRTIVGSLLSQVGE